MNVLFRHLANILELVARTCFAAEWRHMSWALDTKAKHKERKKVWRFGTTQQYDG